MNPCKCPIFDAVKDQTKPDRTGKPVIYRVYDVDLTIERDTGVSNDPVMMAGNRILVENLVGNAFIALNERENHLIHLSTGLQIKGNFERFWVVNEAQDEATLSIIVSSNLEVNISVPQTGITPVPPTPPIPPTPVDPIFYTITYEPNGGVEAEFSEFARQGRPYALARGGFTQTGKKLVGWGTSTMGISNWTSRASGVTSYITSFTYGNGKYVASSYNGEITSSPDGFSWAQPAATSLYTSFSLTYGNGRFALVCGSVFTSIDCVTWTVSPVGAPSTTFVQYLNGQFVTCADYFTARYILTSPDCVTWTQRFNLNSVSISYMAYGNGQYVGVSTNDATIVTSPDTINWQISFDIVSGAKSVGIAYGNGVFVCIFLDGRIMTSVDTVNWTIRQLANALNSITFGDGLFVITDGNSNTIYTSPDANTWTKQVVNPDSSNPMYSLYYANGLYLAGGESSAIFTATPKVSAQYKLGQPFNPYALGDKTLQAVWS